MRPLWIDFAYVVLIVTAIYTSYVGVERVLYLIAWH